MNTLIGINLTFGSFGVLCCALLLACEAVGWKYAAGQISKIACAAMAVYLLSWFFILRGI